MPTVKLSGHYTIHKGNIETGQYDKVAEFDNIILDQGLARMASNNWYDRVVASDDIGPHLAADVGFAVGSTSYYSTTKQNAFTFGMNADLIAPYSTTDVTFRLSAGTFPNNFKVRSVGVAGASNDAGIFSKALVVDENGDPAEIEMMATDYLDVTYSLRFYHDTQVQTGTITIEGLVYDYEIIPIQVLNRSNSSGSTTFSSMGWSGYTGDGSYGAFGTTTAAATSEGLYASSAFFTGTPFDQSGTNPSGWRNGSGSTRSWPGNNTVVYKGVWPITTGNGNIRSVWWVTRNFSYVVNFRLQSNPSSGIDKSNTKELELTFTVGWDRYTP